MVNKTIALGLLAIMSFSLVACVNNVQYNAQFYDDAGQWMHEEFLIENLTLGAFYEGVYLDDDSYPKNISVLIQSKEEFNSIFKEYTSEIDFTKRMVCIFIFTCNYVRPYEISKVSVDNKVLKIKIKSIKIKGASGDAVRSWQRCLVVEMDKLDISSVEFLER